MKREKTVLISLLLTFVMMVNVACAREDEGPTIAAADITKMTEDDERTYYSVKLGENDKNSLTIGATLSGVLPDDIDEQLSETYAEYGREVTLDELDDLFIYGINGSMYKDEVPCLMGDIVSLYVNYLDDPELVIEYDPDNLKGVPESNLIVVYDDFFGMGFKEIEGIVIDTGDHTITCKHVGTGDYYVVDSERWYALMGMSDPVSSGYGNSNWEFSCNTGDIMDLVDEDWIFMYKNAPFFPVSTPEELASFVYYVNTFEDDDPYFVLDIEDDIDLTGYEWASMGWFYGYDPYPFRGVIEGNGHTINGMHIESLDDSAGFVGYSDEGVEIRNLNFTNAYVSAPSQVGIVGGQIYNSYSWENISVQGEIECPGDDYGAIIGRETVTLFVDCDIDVTVNGEPFGYNSYKEMKQAEVPVVETFFIQLTDDYSIIRDQHDGFLNLRVEVYCDDELVFETILDDDETTIPASWQWDLDRYGKYKVYLTAWDYDNEFYIRVSNIIFYERTR